MDTIGKVYHSSLKNTSGDYLLSAIRGRNTYLYADVVEQRQQRKGAKMAKIENGTLIIMEGDKYIMVGDTLVFLPESGDEDAASGIDRKDEEVH